MLRSIATVGVSLTFVLGAAPAMAAADGLEPNDAPVDSRVLDSGAEPLVDIRYRWSEGQTESTTLELWTAQSRYFGELATDEYRPIPFRVEVSAVVQRVDPDGRALVESRVDEVALLEPSADAAATAMLADLETLLDVVVREEYDDKGHLLADALVDPLEDADDLHPARDVALGTIKGRPVRLPLEPVGVGGTWEEVLDSTDDPIGTETITKRLEAIGEDGSYRISSSTVAEVPEQEVFVDELGLEEPAVARGGGVASQEGQVDSERLFPAWTGTYEAWMAMELPIGNGVTVTMETSAGASASPAGWADPAWPQLPPIAEALLPPEPEPSAAVPEAITTPATIEVVLHDPGLEPRQPLRYELAEGQVEHTAMTMRMGLRSVLDGAWTEWLGMPPTEFATTTTVTDVLADGSYRIEILYTDVRMPADPGQLPPEAIEEMEMQLATLIGLRQTIHLDDRGRVIEAVTELPPGASSEALQPAQLDALTQELLDPLPEEPVGVGAVWEVARQTSDAMGFPASGSNTVTLSEADPDGRLRLEADVSLTAEPGPMTIPEMEFVNATIDRFSTAGAGDRVVDLGLINPVSASSEALSDYAFTITFGEVAETTEMQMSMEFETLLVSPAGD